MSKIDLRDVKILLSGGSGDLGITLAPKLLAGGARVRSIDLHSASNAQIDERLGSILDRELVVEAIEGVDIVVHIAA